MYPTKVLLALAVAIGFGAAIEQDGAYLVKSYNNGTITYKSLSDPAVERTIDRRDLTDSAPELSTRSAKFALSKRRTDCWNYQLDHAGVDSAYEGLKGWAGSGRDLQSYPDANAYIAYISKGAMAYYCINRPNSKGNLDVKDVQYALEQMDAKCIRYDASWFAWDGTPEIVGKAKPGDLVCQGGCC